jgi:hypothetical protein
MKIDNKNGTKIFAAVLTPAKMMNIAATVTKPFIIGLLFVNETMRLFPLNFYSTNIPYLQRLN